MSEIIKYLLGIEMTVCAVGQLPRATAFMAKEFARVQHQGLGSLEKFTRALQGGY